MSELRISTQQEFNKLGEDLLANHMAAKERKRKNQNMMVVTAAGAVAAVASIVAIALLASGPAPKEGPQPQPGIEYVTPSGLETPPPLTSPIHPSPVAS